MIHAPTCPACDLKARMTTGREVYPHRRDLWEKPVYVCDGCGARVGCHPGTIKPLGLPVDEATRKARIILHHSLIDPLWKNAWQDPAYEASQAHPDGGRRANGQEARKARNAICRAARGRVYAFLAHKLGIDGKDCHTGCFDVETCRRAWRALRGVSYSDIRAWSKEARQ